MTGLYNESGGHRIQRVPPTERKGRVHTSTVTVAITDPTVPEFKIKDSDLRVEWYSGTGPGGQNKNKVKCSCRLTHIPTGTVSTAQTRERPNSYKQAFDSLTEKVLAHYTSAHLDNKRSDVRAQIGSGMRGDKIRTIRFQDDTATDHKNSKSIRARDYMAGCMDRLW